MQMNYTSKQHFLKMHAYTIDAYLSLLKISFFNIKKDFLINNRIKINKINKSDMYLISREFNRRNSLDLCENIKIMQK